MPKLSFQSLFDMVMNSFNEEMRRIFREDDEEYLIICEHKDKIADKQDTYERIRGC